MSTRLAFSPMADNNRALKLPGPQTVMRALRARPLALRDLQRSTGLGLTYLRPFLTHLVFQGAALLDNQGRYALTPRGQASIAARMERLLASLSEVPLDPETAEAIEAAALGVDAFQTSQRRQERFARLLPQVVSATTTLQQRRASKVREAIQARLAADAYAKMSASAGGNATVVTIAIPQKWADKFPDAERFNHGLAPHLTVLYIGSDLDAGKASTALHLLRHAAKDIAPFRVFVDTQSGLDVFGEKNDAYVFPAKSEPRPALGLLNSSLKAMLNREAAFDVTSKFEYSPHVTWAYVPDATEDQVRKMNQTVSDRFPGGFWFDVRHLFLSMPDGSQKIIPLAGKKA